MKDISEKLVVSEILTVNETYPEDFAYQNQTGKESTTDGPLCP
jgi:hypothetical protein